MLHRDNGVNDNNNFQNGYQLGNKCFLIATTNDVLCAA